MDGGGSAAAPALVRTWDLWFGDSADYLRPRPPDLVGFPRAVPGAVRAGWTGVDGPAIKRTEWPRHPVHGLPMLHVLTMWLPDEYRRQGPALPGIAFFAGGGEFTGAEPAAVGDTGSDDPVLRDLATAQRHPQLRMMTDLLNGCWGLIWLTRAELTGSHTPPPADVRPYGRRRRPKDQGQSPWFARVPASTLWQTVREDPNTGIAPTERHGDGAYTDGRLDQHWVSQMGGRSHLGGTCLSVQQIPDGLSPYYLELEEFGDVNFGGGNAQIDLESGAFGWSC